MNISLKSQKGPVFRVKPRVKGYVVELRGGGERKKTHTYP